MITPAPFGTFTRSTAPVPQVFVVADGGLDLEHYEIRSFKELRSILMQVRGRIVVSRGSCECLVYTVQHPDAQRARMACAPPRSF
jgi:hypothetical protein